MVYTGRNFLYNFVILNYSFYVNWFQSRIDEFDHPHYVRDMRWLLPHFFRTVRATNTINIIEFS